MLSKRLRASGAHTFRLGFNSADQLFWRGPGYIPFRDGPEHLADRLRALVKEKGITDLVCYGSSRPIHRDAMNVADELGLTKHVFEEGYLRPYWVTYERGGANASSRTTQFSLAEMEKAVSNGAPAIHEAPDRWGDMRAHMFWGAAYHARLLVGNKAYPGFKPHRSPDFFSEFLLHLRKLLSAPSRTLTRGLATFRVRHGGFPYHLVLLQLAHDANFLDHGPFPDQATFLGTVFKGFAEGAPRHHHLVLKAHPLEDGREPLRPLIEGLTKQYDLAGRVHFLTGGKLAKLLNTARSALTVNSTSAEQALWRALPLRAFGDAVYNRPQFVSSQPLTEFFMEPKAPDRDAYLVYRRFLLATSQIPGGYYGILSRRKLLRQMPDLMLEQNDTYEKLLKNGNAASPQHIRIVQ